MSTITFIVAASFANLVMTGNSNSFVYNSASIVNNIHFYKELVYALFGCVFVIISSYVRRVCGQ